jgi:hypothetical protein
MHGLQTIITQNVQAQIYNNTLLREQALKQGKTVLVTLDALGNPNHDIIPIVFDTRTLAKQYAAAHPRTKFNTYWGDVV